MESHGPSTRFALESRYLCRGPSDFMGLLPSAALFAVQVTGGGCESSWQNNASECRLPPSKEINGPHDKVQARPHLHPHLLRSKRAQLVK